MSLLAHGTILFLRNLRISAFFRTFRKQARPDALHMMERTMTSDPTFAHAPELVWLARVALLTGCLWIPYILQLIVQLGPVKAVWDPTGAHPHNADWALRAKRAHYNAVENLAVFAPLALIVGLTGSGTATTAAAAATYFWLRLAHFVIHTAAIPVIRTLVFIGGFVCQTVLAMHILWA
jgi:uncharacterized MAPEG superfamily protein